MRASGILALSGLALSGLALVASAQDGDADLEGAAAQSERCLSLQRIRDTEVIDDSTIIFEMRGRQFYVNSLPRPCPNLAREGAFSYEVRTPQLCSTDSIRVLESFAGRPRAGVACRIGVFAPISAEQVEFIRAETENADRNRRNGPTATSLPREEAAEEDDPGQDEEPDEEQDEESGQDD